MNTKLNDIKIILLDDFYVGVNKGMEFVEEFKADNVEKMREYGNALVISIHIIDENLLAVNIDIS